MGMSTRRTLQSLAAGIALAGAVLPQGASAQWTRVSASRSASEPYFACPGGGRSLACQLISDPTRGTGRRGAMREGAITTGPEQEVSPALHGSGVEGGYSPQDLRRAYALPSEIAGAGQTVAIVDAFDDPNAEADMNHYRSEYGIASCTASSGCFRKADQNGGTSYPQPDAGWAGEISLDLDMASAVCPKCHILLVEANTNFASDFAAAENEAAALGATEISNSFGGEAPVMPAQIASAYNHPGIAIAAAGGDHGYGVSVPAASPHVTAVGGTSLVPATSSRGWSESVWYGVQEGVVWGTGSGCSEEA
jgi:subtilase family serine protease